MKIYLEMYHAALFVSFISLMVSSLMAIISVGWLMLMRFNRDTRER